MKRWRARLKAEREKTCQDHQPKASSWPPKLTNAARVIARNLRLSSTLSATLTEIAVEKNSTILFPVPIEFMRAFKLPAGEADDKPAG